MNVEDLRVHFDLPSSPNADRAREDVRAYLARLWSIPDLQVHPGPPALTTPHAIWISTSEEAAALAGRTSTLGYGIRSAAQGSARRLVVHGASEVDAIHGTYALLEELGVRFFHPMQELVPSMPGIFLPPALAIERAPAYRVRGIQLHLLHPLEYFDAFNAPGPENLDHAKRFIDWLVKTGQNHVQWCILRTVDFDAWVPHAEAILAYAHDRGVTVGAVVDLWGGSSLQNAYDLITSEDHWAQELESQMDRLMTLPWDVVEMGLGEFLASDPSTVVTWLDHATAYMSEAYPNTTLSITNHVGNYPELWVDFEGREVFFYHLPGYADPRLANDVHTIFFFDLFRGWGGYGHADFGLHRDFLFEQLGRREMRYMPESAYWCTADIDVPLLLTEYIHARWVDVHGLAAEIRERGLPSLDGHVLFSSGHEWGYWMTDYLTAKMLWAPDADFSTFLDEVPRAFGTCSLEVGDALHAYTALQTEYLFDRRLVGYLSGEDLHDDLGFLVGITTHPTRRPYHELLAMPDAELDAFEGEVVGGLESFASRVEPLEATLRGVCDRSDEALGPWCRELHDGVRVTRLRALHAARLYRAVVSHARGGESAAHLAEARRLRALAASVIRARESEYRFEAEKLTSAYANPTRYPFGYLRQAHTQCLWGRQELQAAAVIEVGAQPAFTVLPSCQD